VFLRTSRCRTFDGGRALTVPGRDQAHPYRHSCHSDLCYLTTSVEAVALADRVGGDGPGSDPADRHASRSILPPGESVCGRFHWRAAMNLVPCTLTLEGGALAPAGRPNKIWSAFIRQPIFPKPRCVPCKPFTMPGGHWGASAQRLALSAQPPMQQMAPPRGGRVAARVLGKDGIAQR